jgi:hypothetical protein
MIGSKYGASEKEPYAPRLIDGIVSSPKDIALDN